MEDSYDGPADFVNGVGADIWNVFEPPTGDNLTVEYNYAQIQLRNPIQYPKTTKYELYLESTDAKCRPAKSYLILQGTILQTDRATATVAAQKVTHQNTGFFTKTEYYINGGNLVDGDSSYAGQSWHHKMSTELSNDYAKGSGSNSGWIRDTGIEGGLDIRQSIVVSEHTNAGAPNYTVPTAATQNFRAVDTSFIATGDAAGPLSVIKNSKFNEGFFLRQRSQRDGSAYNGGTGVGVDFYYVIPLNKLFNIWKYIDKVFVGYTHKMVLTFAGYNDIIFGDGFGTAGTANTAYTVNFKNMYWMMPYLKPSIPVELSLAQQLKAGKSQETQFEVVTTYLSPMTTSGTKFSWNVTTPSEKITRMFFAFQLATDLGSQTANAGIYRHFNATDYKVRMGQVVLPRESISVDWPTKNYGRCFQDYLKATDHDDDYSAGSAENFDEYGATGPKIAFDVRDNQDLNPSAAGQQVNVLFTATLQSPPGANYYCWSWIHTEKNLVMSSIENKILATTK